MEVLEVSSNEEKISDSFICCICLDLLHKPIVLSCGHISCFWCVHKSMSIRRESHCPICRNAYNHFPNICQMLHFLLQKMYPVAYKRRESQVFEEEKKNGHFSPQFESSVLHDTCTNTPEEAPSDGNQNSLSDQQSQICKQITVKDVLCGECKQLLFRPVVLNCGHVYCESCVVHFGNEMLRCQVCQSLHPKGVPKVFLELDKFLEEHFPNEYKEREKNIQHTKVDVNDTSIDTNQADNPPLSDDREAIIHVGVGCDFCGMYPISGERYRCKDCKELMGFDLCSNCYNTPSKLPGRFNQKHTSEHEFELVQPVPVHPLAFIARGHLLDSTTGLIIGTYSITSSEDGSTPVSLTSSTEENVDQDDSQSTA